MTHKPYYHVAIAWLPLIAVISYATIISSVTALTICPYKLLLGHDCPTCGTTRGVFALLSGQFAKSFNYNPIAYVITIVAIRHGIVGTQPKCRSLAWLQAWPIDALILVCFFFAGLFHFAFAT